MVNFIKFIYRFCKGFFILLCLSVPLEILGWVLLIFPCIFQGTSLKPLPVFLRWFDNADQYIGRNTTTYMNVYKSGRFNRYCWLAFRNPCNYFGYKYLGVQVKNSISQISYNGSDKTGFMSQEVLIDGKIYYEYSYIHPWSTKKCFKFRSGYKIADLKSNHVGSYIEAVFQIQPNIDYHE